MQWSGKLNSSWVHQTFVWVVDEIILHSIEPDIIPDAVKFDFFLCSVSILLSFGSFGDDVPTGDVERNWLVILFLSPGVGPLLRNSNN